MKPLLFFISIPAEGHTNPLLTIAESMVKRGYTVAYVCSAGYREKIIEAGAEFFEMPWGWSKSITEEEFDHLKVPMNLERYARQFAHIFFHPLPARLHYITKALEAVRARHPDRQIIIVEDSTSLSVLPFRYGRPLPLGFSQMPRTIAISPTALMIQSQDTAPFYLGLPPDSSDSGRLRNASLYQLLHDGTFKPLVEAWKETLRRCGCTTEPTGKPLYVWYGNHLAYDKLVMLCSPSLEYPLSDMPDTIEFAGCLPQRGITTTLQYPGWWQEVLRKGNKKVIFVSQGTVNKDWRELLIPTLEAFAGREDILVIAALGFRGAALPDTVYVPSNARVIDYFPYDAVLPLADVFVSNGGYGAFSHAVMNGVASVFAGERQDKSEVAMRAEWAGFAYNLKTQRPTIQALQEAVNTVLGNPRFKQRAIELKAENETMDSMSRIERVIESLSEESPPS
ncbi:putative glycosyltransferase [Trichoderma sp. SZMC 28012]